jgi:intracellular sulfur oxidation DsrE/DsrF family protein
MPAPPPWSPEVTTFPSLPKRRQLLLAVPALLLLPLAAAHLPALAQAPAPKPNRIVFQVSDADEGKWNLALGNARNVQAEFGAGNVDVEIVAYGPGIGMLKAGSPVKDKIDAAMKSGVTMAACQNTMRNMSLTPKDMLAEIGYVPSGVGELLRKQQQGWAYVRP